MVINLILDFTSGSYSKLALSVGRLFLNGNSKLISIENYKSIFLDEEEEQQGIVRCGVYKLGLLSVKILQEEYFYISNSFIPTFIQTKSKFPKASSKIKIILNKFKKIFKQEIANNETSIMAGIRNI